MESQDFEEEQRKNELSNKPNSTFETSIARKGFVEKYYEHLRWSVSLYFLFFALWGAYTFLSGVLPAIDNLKYTLPLLAFIITSAVGSIRLLKNKPNAYNYLIAAQLPQIVILQLNGFIYVLLVGQWIILKISGLFNIGLFFGILDAKYTFVFGSADQIEFLFGINIVPIILIFILLRMEDIEKKSVK